MSDLCGGLVLLFGGTLYPAYSSYKAVKNKNTREYVKWMMYWIVFAFFTSITLFTDIFLSWFPGYYLFKTLFILWLVSPATRGSTYLYKKVVHPALRKHEEKIDKSIENIKERGYDYSSQWARLAMQNFSRALMEAVFRGQMLVADQMQRQYMQQGNTGAQFPSGSSNSNNVVTDGREVERLSRSTSEGRLYRVDSQMFEMDDEFIDLSADVSGESQAIISTDGSFGTDGALVVPYNHTTTTSNTNNTNTTLIHYNVITEGHVVHQSRDTEDLLMFLPEDSEFEELELDVIASEPQLRQRKQRGMRPASMPVPPTINEHEVYSDEAAQSDPDYQEKPKSKSSRRRHSEMTRGSKPARSSGRRTRSKQEQEVKTTRVTRSASRRHEADHTATSSDDVRPADADDTLD